MSFNQVSTVLLKHIAHQASPALLPALVQYLPAALARFEINTSARVAHFLGQCAEESAGFRTLTEYASGNEYEGRRDLGNTHAGDGVRYKGRGLLQITGRYNYTVYGQKLGVDLVDNPTLAATAQYACLTAAQFWHDHNLNALADASDISAITRKINGGLNGLADRETFTARAKAALAASPVVIAPAQTAPVRVSTATPTIQITTAPAKPGFWSRLHTLLTRKA